MCCSAVLTWNRGKIKRRLHRNLPLKRWLSSGSSPLLPCNWLWLACGGERSRGSTGQTRRVFQRGTDVAIIPSASIQKAERAQRLRVREMRHEGQSWVGMVRPAGNARSVTSITTSAHSNLSERQKGINPVDHLYDTSRKVRHRCNRLGCLQTKSSTIKNN